MKFTSNISIKRSIWGLSFAAFFLPIQLANALTADPSFRKPAIVPSAAASTVDTLAKLNGKIFKLLEGSLTLCPERLGFTTSLQKKRIQIYPLREGANTVAASAEPFLEIRNLSEGKTGDPETEMDANQVKRKYLASISNNRIHSIVTTTISENQAITTNAEISFLQPGLRLVRWSTATGEPLLNKIECTYQVNKNSNLALRY